MNEDGVRVYSEEKSPNPNRDKHYRTAAIIFCIAVYSVALEPELSPVFVAMTKERGWSQGAYVALCAVPYAVIGLVFWGFSVLKTQTWGLAGMRDKLLVGSVALNLVLAGYLAWTQFSRKSPRQMIISLHPGNSTVVNGYLAAGWTVVKTYQATNGFPMGILEKKD